MLGPRYEIQALIGEGAMGRVYLARNRELGRLEAVKVLRPELARDDKLWARFRREARATGRLAHPNIVALYDYDRLPEGMFSMSRARIEPASSERRPASAEREGTFFISMEYVEGKSLSAVLRDEVMLPVPRAVFVLKQLAAAVEHAHSRGVLHRDLKPANLMLATMPGQADLLKVLDFGIAKIITPGYAESILVSQNGVVFGTPLYMAPEQVGQQTSDPRSDIYSIGCVAMELVTGEPPFRGSVMEVMSAHATEDPPWPSALAPTVPPELDRIILRCLAKRPEDRYQSAGALLADLEVLSRQPIDVTLRGTPDQIMGPAEVEHEAPLRVLMERAEQLIASVPETIAIELARLLSGARDAEQAVDVQAAERLVFEAEREQVEVDAHERQARLEGAIAALCAERDTGGAEPTLAYQIAALEQRLAEVRVEDEVRLAALGERAIELAARDADLGDRLRDMRARLERAVVAAATLARAGGRAGTLR